MPSPTQPFDAAQVRVGTVLDGRWRLDALIAVGGCSAIYAATHRNGHRVAVKVLNPLLAANELAVTHFLREGLVANRVGHPGAVAVVDEGRTADGAPFLLMPLLDGESALQRLHRQPNGLPVREALAIVDAVLDVLVAAHARGVVHRDLKPENVFLERGGGVRILDFGIARLHDLALTDETMPGTVMGTPGFMAPEQARGQTKEVGPQSDLWAVGALLYTLLTGRVLHQGGTLMEQIVRAGTHAVPPACELVAGVPDGVAGLLDGALAFDPKDRWGDAAAMRLAARVALDEVRAIEAAGSCAGVTVDALAAHASSSDAPVAMPAPRASRWQPVAWIAAACMAAAGVAFVATHGRTLSRAHAAAAPLVVAPQQAPLPPAESLAPPTAVEVSELPQPAAPKASAATLVPSASARRPSPPAPAPAPARQPTRRDEIVRAPGF